MELSYEAVCFDLFGTLVTAGGAAIEGVHAALATLSGARWAIVTSCGRSYALHLLAAAAIPAPSVLVSSGDTARNKPASDPYVLAAERLGVAPARILVVEDSASGALAGRGAGMDVVIVGGGRSAAADFSVGRFADITWAVDSAGAIQVRW
jgi:sugar-phosphatase